MYDLWLHLQGVGGVSTVSDNTVHVLIQDSTQLLQKATHVLKDTMDIDAGIKLVS